MEMYAIEATLLVAILMKKKLSRINHFQVIIFIINSIRPITISLVNSLVKTSIQASMLVREERERAFSSRSRTDRAESVAGLQGKLIIFLYNEIPQLSTG